MVTKFIAILILAAGAAGVFAVQHKADDALPCDESAAVEQVVVTAKRNVGE